MNRKRSMSGRIIIMLVLCSSSILYADLKDHLNIFSAEGQLVLAVQYAKPCLVRLLCKRVLRNATDDENARTIINCIVNKKSEPLIICATKSGRLNIVSLLIDEFDADVDQPDKWGHTALHYANFRLTKELIDNGARLYKSPIISSPAELIYCIRGQRLKEIPQDESSDPSFPPYLLEEATQKREYLNPTEERKEEFLRSLREPT